MSEVASLRVAPLRATSLLVWEGVLEQNLADTFELEVDGLLELWVVSILELRVCDREIYGILERLFSGSENMSVNKNCVEVAPCMWLMGSS